MTEAAIALAALLLLHKLMLHALVVRFFRRPTPAPARLPERITILLPVVSGDPTLRDCLAHNLRVECACPLEYLLLLDEDDAEAWHIARALVGEHPDREVTLVPCAPPPDRASPKMFKLALAAPRARGDVLCVLDDDTMLPPGGLEQAVAALDSPGVGLAFGLPYYVSFANLPSRLVAYFVNSHSLMTYAPYSLLRDPFTINGMFYVLRRDTLDRTGGLAGLEATLADDFAIAAHMRKHGLRLAQTAVRHPLSTHVSGPAALARLLHRWFTFPRETLMRGLPWRDLAVTYGLAFLAAVAPLLLGTLLFASPSWPLAIIAIAYVVHHYFAYAHFNLAYLRRASPWRGSWLVVAIQLLLPFALLVTLLSRQRVHWRGNVMQIERGGTFRYLRRRGE